MKKCNIIILLLFITILSGCVMQNDSMDDINITVCGIENPDWLILEMSEIFDGIDNYRPVKVSVYEEYNTEVISVEDPVNSNASEGLMFFDCNGKRVEFNSERHNHYFKLLQEKEFTLLWSN